MMAVTAGALLGSVLLLRLLDWMIYDLMSNETKCLKKLVRILHLKLKSVVLMVRRFIKKILTFECLKVMNMYSK